MNPTTRPLDRPTTGTGPPAPRADLLDRCRRVGDLARSQSQRTDREGVLPPEVIAALGEERLLSMTLPRALGGLACSPEEVVGAVAALTRADASLGWTALIGQSSGFLSWMDPDAAADIVRETPHPRVAGSMAPAGQGSAAPGPDGEPGYRLSGRWPYNSGCRHAQWIVVAFVCTGDRHEPTSPPREGPPPVRWAVVPAGGVRTSPTWDVLGLRGTASDDVVIDDVWVPARRTFDPLREPARQEGPLFRHSLFTFLMVVMAGFPIGLTRHVLDEFTGSATGRGRLGSGGPLIEDPLVRTRLLGAHSEARAAELLVTEAVAALGTAPGAGALPVRAALAASVQHAQRVCLDTAEWAFHTVGGGAVHLGHPLQRAWRDAMTASSHIAFSTGTVGRTARALLTPESLEGVDALLV